MKSNKPWTHWTILLCATLLAAGCAATNNSGNWCDIAKPIWWDSTMQLDATPTPIVRQIVEHNETVMALCR